MAAIDSENKGDLPVMFLRRLKWVRMRSVKDFAILCAILLVLETLSLAFTFTWYHFREVNSYPFLDKFALTRYLVSPLIFDNPARKIEGVTYIGPRERRRADAQWYKSDALFGWRPAPSISILKQPNRVKEPVGWKMTNSQGFPVAGSYDYFYERPKPAGTFRIIVMGASHVEGDGAETPLDNLPSSIHFAVDNAKPGGIPRGFERLEVINAGIGAFTSSQEVLFLLSELVTYEPNLVIAYGGAVDLIVGRINLDQQNTADSGFDYRKRAENSARLDQSYSLRGSLMMFSENVINEVRMIIDELAMTYVASKAWEKFYGLIGPVQKVGATKDGKKATSDSYIEAALKTYQANIGLMAAAAEIHDFRIAFVLEPVMATGGKVRTPIEEEVYADLSEREIQARAKYYQKARKLYETLSTRYPDRSKVCLFDISRAFADVQERVFEDSTHLLGAGNRILAARIKDELGNCGMLGVAAARH